MSQTYGDKSGNPLAPFETGKMSNPNEGQWPGKPVVLTGKHGSYTESMAPHNPHSDELTTGGEVIVDYDRKSTQRGTEREVNGEDWDLRRKMSKARSGVTGTSSSKD